MEEPSVLDYLKAKLMPWRGQKVDIPSGQPVEEEAAALLPDNQPAGEEPSPPILAEGKPEAVAEISPEAVTRRKGVPWVVFLALVLAIVAQSFLEPPARLQPAFLLYVLALLACILAVVSYRSFVPPLRPETETGSFSMDVRTVPFIISVVLMFAGFLLFGGNLFTPLNLTVWFVLLAYTFWTWWIPRRSFKVSWAEARGWLQRDRWQLHISRWTLVLLAAFALAAFFRFYRLSEVPGEMFSDQAEKLYDVMDVLNGETHLYFQRNTGREFFQFYLTAAIIKLFGTGISFLSLKLGTALAGFFTLPYIYLLGKELGGRRLGLIVLVIAGIAYWPNVIARIGLRFPLYPLFAAPALYYLIRGLRHRNRNDFILAGLAVGLGLHGYSPFRIMPFVLAFGLGIYLLHRQSRGNRSQAFWALVVLGLVAFVVFLPLFRYAVMDNPELFNARALSRIGSQERPLPGPALEIFLKNQWSSLLMPFLNNGNVWVHSVVNRPALDVITAALFLIGLVLVIARYVRGRNWVDLFLLLSIPLLMLPSTLSLAFPEENPSLNRSGGAYIPIFLISAIGLEGILITIREMMGRYWGRLAVGMLTIMLFIGSASQNYDLVFHQFERQFMLGAWNTTEIAGVVRGFADSIGTPETAYVIPYPYWVDTRLVGINAGFPGRDYALPGDQLQTTLNDGRTLMFILKPEDEENLQKLTGMYPGGVLTRYNARRQGKDFLVYLVPGVSNPVP